MGLWASLDFDAHCFLNDSIASGQLQPIILDLQLSSVAHPA